MVVVVVVVRDLGLVLLGHGQVGQFKPHVVLSGLFCIDLQFQTGVSIFDFSICS